MTNQPADGERYYYESIKSDALSLEDEYEVDFRGLMDAEYNKLCVEQKTCTVNCAMVREAWRRLMLDAPAALATAAEQLREKDAAMERLQAENELQRKCLNKMLISVRNACTILGGEIFLAEFDKPRLYEPALKVHDYLRKLVDAVYTMMGEVK